MARKLKRENFKIITFPEDKEITFKIKPMSVLYLTKFPKDGEYTPDILWEQFRTCLIDWTGIEYEDGTKIECNDKSKRKLAEEDTELFTFVINGIREYSEKDKPKEEEIKN
jgi:hypothetical protein